MDILELRGVLTLVLALGLVTLAEGNCILDVGDGVIHSTYKHPLLVSELSPGVGELLHPELSNGPNATLQFNIPDNTNLISSCTGNPPNTDLTCKNGQLVFSQHPSSKVEWVDLVCNSLPGAIINGQGNFCDQNVVPYRIGWNIRPNLFVPLIDICFDANTETTQLTRHKIQGRSVGAKMVSSRHTFRPEGMFSVDVNETYKKTNAVALFKQLLGTDKYLTGNGEDYLARGHLTPDADFFYTAEQAATYFFANAVPQWHSTNNGNWGKRIEYRIRKLAETHMATFKVWTGTYGTLQFPNVNNNIVFSMFLGLREQKRVIPVPAVMWKVIQNPDNKEAVAFVQINDNKGEGSSMEINLNPPLCDNVCNQLNWIDTSNFNNTYKGLTFCCSVSDLRTKIPILPDLGNVGLLEN